MAATGKTPILLYGSTTPTNTPTAGNLTNSSDGCEIAINVADKNLFFKDSTNAVNIVPIRQSSGSSDGWLSSANWTTFNSKQAAYTNLTSIGSLANATGWLYNNGSGTFSYSTPSASDVGAVPTSRTVSTTSPLAGGGALSSNLTLSITQATTSTNGYLSSTDWNTFNNKQPAGTYVTSVTGTAPVVSSGGTTPAISMAAASGSTNGYLSSTDWTTFNGKAPAFTYTSGYIPFGQGTTTPNQSVNLFWDNSNTRLGINNSSPAKTLDVGGVIQSNRSLGGGSFDGIYSYTNSGNVYTYSDGSYLATYTNNTERIRVFNSGGVSIGNTTDPSATNLSVSGKVYAGTTSSLGTGELHVRGGIIGDNNSSDGNFNIEARSGTIYSSSIYNSTTAVGASVCITNVAGFLQRSTSSIKYKTDVEDLNENLSANIYKMRPVWYRSLCETDKKEWSWYGLIAEEVAEVEPRLVHWGAPDENGKQEPEGVMYDRLTVFLLKEIQLLKAKIELLENK